MADMPDAGASRKRPDGACRIRELFNDYGALKRIVASRRQTFFLSARGKRRPDFLPNACLSCERGRRGFEDDGAGDLSRRRARSIHPSPDAMTGQTVEEHFEPAKQGFLQFRQRRCANPFGADCDLRCVSKLAVPPTELRIGEEGVRNEYRRLARSSPIVSRLVFALRWPLRQPDSCRSG
jgi:hypothetical protein